VTTGEERVLHMDWSEIRRWK